MRWFAVAAGLLALALSVASPASAEQAAPEGWAYAYFNEVMSPFCPGRTLSACTSGQAETLRMWILVQDAAGRSKEDVHAELFERYGDILLAAPQAKGFGLAAYIIPLVVFLAGGLLVLVFLRRQTAKAGAAAAPASTPFDADLERAIDEELARAADGPR
ncbi:MAG: cytochrome c-type biogenesis protein CcmH [Myxococcota bacterium]